MKPILAPILLVILLGHSGCISRPNGSPLLGEYQMVAVDHSGRRVFTGSISLTSQEQNLAKGQCKIIKEKDAGEAILDQDARCQAFMGGRKSLSISPPLLMTLGSFLRVNSKMAG